MLRNASRARHTEVLTAAAVDPSITATSAWLNPSRYTSSRTDAAGSVGAREDRELPTTSCRVRSPEAAPREARAPRGLVERDRSTRSWRSSGARPLANRRANREMLGWLGRTSPQRGPRQRPRCPFVSSGIRGPAASAPGTLPRASSPTSFPLTRNLMLYRRSAPSKGHSLYSAGAAGQSSRGGVDPVNPHRLPGASGRRSARRSDRYPRR